jgi:hypothetical protein
VNRHRRQRGGEDVDQIVAEQQGADQPFACFGQLADQAGAFVARFLALHHARARHRRQRRFGAGEKGGENQKAKDRKACEPNFGGDHLKV